MSQQKEEQQYLDLLKQILQHGTWEEGRNGRTKSIFGSCMRFSLTNNKIPILTTKKVAWKTCLKELLWFLSGKTSNKIIEPYLDYIQLDDYEDLSKLVKNLEWVTEFDYKEIIQKLNRK